MVRLICIAMGAAVLTLSTGCGEPVERPVENTGVRLLKLSGFETDPSGERVVLKVYVQPAEDFKAEWYRFELYDFAQYEANLRGRRLMLWPEAAPGEPDVKNPRWRAHLDAYEFVLPVDSPPALDTSFVVEVTAMGTDGRRRSDLLKLVPNLTN